MELGAKAAAEARLAARTTARNIFGGNTINGVRLYSSRASLLGPAHPSRKSASILLELDLQLSFRLTILLDSNVPSPSDRMEANVMLKRQSRQFDHLLRI